MSSGEVLRTPGGVVLWPDNATLTGLCEVIPSEVYAALTLSLAQQRASCAS